MQRPGARRPGSPKTPARAGPAAPKARLARPPGKSCPCGAGQRWRRCAVHGHTEEQAGPDCSLVDELVPVAGARAPDAWLFDAAEGGPLRESNWKRSVGWRAATAAAGVPGFRVHDLRHAAASVWLAADANPKVVQWVLGHATAAMTMDLYGHLAAAVVAVTVAVGDTV